MLYTVKGIAEKCGVTDRSIRYFAEKEGIGRKYGKIWKLTEEEAEIVFRHYSPNSENKEVTEEEAEPLTEEKEPLTENEEDVPQKNVSAGQAAILAQFQATIDVQRDQIEFLKLELERVRAEKDQQIEQLLSEKDRLQSTNDSLLQLAIAQKTRLLEAPRIEVQPQEINIREPKEEKKSFWKRLFG